MPSKSSSLNVLPTSLLKSFIKVFAPVLKHLVNLSVAESCFPLCFKTAHVQHHLKKLDLDCEDLANFRTISNLNTISKIMKRLVLARLGPHLTKSTNFNQVQSVLLITRLRRHFSKFSMTYMSMSKLSPPRLWFDYVFIYIYAYLKMCA